MDYKLNILQKEVRCTEIGINDIQSLKFGHLENDKVVFNATAYLKSIGREDINYRVFSRAMRFWIDRLAEGYGLGIDELFYQNPGGDELYSEILVHFLLMYIDPSVVTYYNDLIDDVMTNGIAFSDSLIFELAQTRMTPELIDQLKNGSKKNSGV